MMDAHSSVPSLTCGPVFIYYGHLFVLITACDRDHLCLFPDEMSSLISETPF